MWFSAEQQPAAGESWCTSPLSSQAAGIHPLQLWRSVQKSHQRDKEPAPISHPPQGPEPTLLPHSSAKGREESGCVGLFGMTFLINERWREAIAIAWAGLQSELFSFLFNGQQKAGGGGGIRCAETGIVSRLCAS